MVILLILQSMITWAETTANVGVVDRMSQTAYDAFNQKCVARSNLGEESLALVALGASVKPDSATLESNEGHFFALLAKAHRENLECDLPKLGSLQNENLAFAAQDFKMKIEALHQTERLIAQRAPQIARQRQALLGRVSGEELRAKIDALNAPLKALYGARESIRNSIPFSEHGPISALINSHSPGPNGAPPLMIDLNPTRLGTLLKSAYGRIQKNLVTESERMEKASKDEGKSLTSPDKNALAKDPALLMQLARGKQENAIKLQGLQCEMNRRFGAGRDILDTTFDAVTLPVALLSGGTALLGRGVKAGLWAQRVSRVVTLRRARMIQSAALALDGVALAKEAHACASDGIQNRSSGTEKTCGETSATVELAQDNCLLKGALLALGAAGTISDLRRISQMINPAQALNVGEKLTGAARVEFAANVRQSIGREVPDTVLDNLWEAHRKGLGQPGRTPGTLAGVNPDGSTNFTLTQLKEKIAAARRVPENQGGVNHDELKRLLDDGVLGTATRLDRSKIIPGLQDDWDKFNATVSDSFLARVEAHADAAARAGDPERGDKALEAWVKLNDCLTRKFENACRKLLAEAKAYTEDYQPRHVVRTNSVAAEREREARAFQANLDAQAAEAARFQPRSGHVFDPRVNADIANLDKLKESQALRANLETFLDATKDGAGGLQTLPNGLRVEKKHGMRSGPGWQAKYGDVWAVRLNDANRIVYEVKDGVIEIRCIGDCYAH